MTPDRDEHVHTVHDRGRGKSNCRYRAECRCGWTSLHRHTKEEADQCGLDHCAAKNKRVGESLSDQDLAEIETVLMDDPVHLPTCAVFFAHLADPDCDCGFTATTRHLIAEIRRLRADIETELGND